MKFLTICVILSLLLNKCTSHETCTSITSNLTCELDIIPKENEQKLTFDELCKTPNGEHEKHLVPTVQNENVAIGQSVTSLCSGKTRGYLKWVTLDFFNEFIRSKINHNLTNEFHIRSETDLPDNNHQSNVLIEVLPTHYLLQDAQLTSAKKIKYGRAIDLGTVQLVNDGNKTQLVTSLIPSTYERRFQIDFANFMGISGLAVEIAHGQNISSDVLDIKNFIYGHQFVKEQQELYEFSKELPADTSGNVLLRGTLTIEEYDICGTVVNFFDNQLSQNITTHNIFARVTDTKITKLKSIWTERSNQVYPGFQPYFQIACVILFGTMFVVFFDVARQLLSGRSKKYQNLNSNRPNNQKELLLQSNKA